jgi:hypothetical protein
MKYFNTYINEKLKITKKMLGNKSIKNMLDNPEDYVDLCLPSGTLWAKCNVGANKEYEMGDLISWGELKPKRKYVPDTYKFGNEKNLTKYTDTDKLTKLELTDDIAHYKDKNMCLPTHEQFTELIKCTDQKWVKNYNDTGVNGMLFTGINDESLFLPAAGCKIDVDNSDDNRKGWYFTNSLYFNQFARFVSFDSMSTKARLYCNGNRYIGMSIRPVLNK